MKKRTLSTALALAMLVPMLLLLASCNSDPRIQINIYPNGQYSVGDGEPVNAATNAPATNAPTVAPEATAAPANTSGGTAAPGTTGVASTTGTGVTNPPGVTDPPAGTTAPPPAGDTIADVLVKYNKAANDTKNYTGKVTVTKVEGSKIAITQMPSWASFLRSTAEGLLPNDYPKAPNVREFNGGTRVDKPEDTLNKFLPPEKKQTVSLEAAGVESAKFTANADGSGQYVIKLKPEVMNGFDIPTYNAQASEYLDISNDDLDPFVFKEGTLTYTGTVLTVDVNKDGLMTKFDGNTPAKAQGNFGYQSLNLLKDCILEGFWKSELEFVYG